MENILYFDKTKHTEEKIIEEGTINNLNWKIVSLGSHPCCYILIPKNHKLYGVGYDDINLNVHGGLTYAKYEGDNWVIGWDYAHLGDLGYYPQWDMPLSQGRIWKIDELKESLTKAINQIDKLQKFQVKEFYYSEEALEYK